MKTSLPILLTLLLLFTSVSSDCVPEQIHLSLSDSFLPSPSAKASPMKVVFTTKDPCPTAYVSLTTPSGIKKITSTSNKCYQRVYGEIIYINCLHIFDFPSTLTFAQSYEYSCFGTSDTAESDKIGPFQFYLPNPKYEEGQETNVVLFADMDDTEFGMPTINRLTKIAQSNFTKISAFFHIGDMAYNLGGDASQKGDKYMNSIQSFTASMPYMVTAGNHENNSNFSNFNMRFKMPLYKKFQNHYYSFEIGNMHFVSFNLDLVIVNPDPVIRKAMLDWLEQDLIAANQNREEKPWIIALTHRPFYCSFRFSDDCEDNSRLFADFEKLLIKQKVDLVLGGHVHIYERMLPIKKGKVGSFYHRKWDSKYRYIINPNSPTHVVQGMAGHKGDEADPQRVYEGKHFTVKVDKDYSFMAVRSDNSTHLKVENYESENGKMNDYFYIIKTDNPRRLKVPYYSSGEKERSFLGKAVAKFANMIFSHFWS